ncbi:hypothetical protein COT78_00605 [Candidatus Berkelbacteria bacterium CG10_big_fil_rev_8_21_14_0_10_43_13]|uniref:DUF11 domain-containing protein n=1 Tax=Candidatus Berkelbacteria bacterium CG10_big_fil_rev_8_21_14_0_10_43_13 TaxID=1974514 RepID=A0A2H0W7B7_9BACT|nr:MAG: hypothetical protein COT78_00605 [Candidatus Berkelbacteria bacterium CG10_big_fil_rev_8_21_14_0_10_43_13]
MKRVLVVVCLALICLHILSDAERDIATPSNAITVSIALSRGLYHADDKTGVKEYVVDLVVENIGSSDVTYELMRVAFFNPSYHPWCQDESEKRIDVRVLNRDDCGNCETTLHPGESVEATVESGPMTVILTEGLGETETACIFVDLVDRDGAVIASFGQSLERLGDLPVKSLFHRRREKALMTRILPL